MRLLLALVLTFPWAWSAMAEGPALPSTITIDGVKYEDVQWGNVTLTTITLRHKTGIATVPLNKLPAELQRRLGYDPHKAEQARLGVAAEQWQGATPAPSEAGAAAKIRLGESDLKITGAFGIALGASVGRINVTGKKKDDWDWDQVYPYQLEFTPGQPSQLIKEYYVWITPKTKKVYCIEGLGELKSPYGNEAERQAKTLFELLAKRYGHVVPRKTGFWNELFSSSDETILIDRRRIVVGQTSKSFKNIGTKDEPVLVCPGGRYKDVRGETLSLFRMQVRYIDTDLEDLAAKEQTELDTESKQREEKEQTDAVKRKFNPTGF